MERVSPKHKVDSGKGRQAGGGKGPRDSKDGFLEEVACEGSMKTGEISARGIEEGPLGEG